MDVSEQDARRSLASVEGTMERTRKAIASSESGAILILWGALLVVCYLLTQVCLGWRPELIWWVWPVVCSLGAVGSFGYYWWGAREGRPVKTAAEKKIGLRVTAFWLLLYLFAGVWVAIAGMRHGIQINAFFVTVIMFAYVVSGLWTDGLYMVWLGLAVTAATLVGYFVLPWAYYNYWMATTAGGMLLGTGIYIRLWWK